MAAALPPLLEEVYETGTVAGPGGEPRDAFPHSIAREHALVLAGLAGAGATRTLETGMGYGASALAIAGMHAGRGEGEHVVIDPAQEEGFDGIGLLNVERAGLSAHVRFLAEPSELALPRLAAEGMRLDLGFVDGLHLFDHALIDFFYVDRMLEPGGHVAFHDLWMPALRQVLAYVLANRAYELVEGSSDDVLAVLRKVADDDRPWDAHVEFPGAQARRGLLRRR